jgi:hypothetical protein
VQISLQNNKKVFRKKEEMKKEPLNSNDFATFLSLDHERVPGAANGGSVRRNFNFRDEKREKVASERENI